MTSPAEITYVAFEDAPITSMEGAVVVFARPGGALGPAAQAADAAAQGAVSRLLASKEFKNKPGDAATLSFPAGMKATRLIVVALGETGEDARRAGSAAAGRLGSGAVTIYGDGAPEAQAEAAFGAALRLYDFKDHKAVTLGEENGEEGDEKPGPAPRRITFASDAPEKVARLSGPMAALAEGVFFTRDLVNEPANILTTDDFAARLGAMGELGLDVEILGEAEMEKLGMRCLLAVGHGSISESKLVVMKWMGGGDEAPLALVGKGVVFDTGGISIKPSSGMEEMTMDMGGAAVVSGVMRTLALRKAKANVVGIVGLVENMPSDRAMRPGDIIRTMKGDTVEIISTDAEGRMVLCDAMWYAQETFRPAAMIDLATLTGAVIIALGNHNAGFFSTDDALANDLKAACDAVGEGAWRLPLGKDYDKQLKSRLADMKNVGGRPAGSITAAQFLKRFVKDGLPWAHIDIAGVTLRSAATDYAPAGATGWGVRSLDRLIADRFEGKR
ncbi:leucyl aminopeptidase [Rubrimonas cliftonensis]|uniref:Probable cytosol aminopeptidase n=1 Tax=Rubrimonas cliftonensis TaxID=89524 RepID=A0A1H3W066_9RHOB|nr:leucyl aminopeptidase [Rubrimonas cliftonensis]SDZ80311.1 leucyl aminopeptidase [Rubrimonas cliftonensis]